MASRDQTLQLPSGFIEALASAQTERAVLDVAATWMPKVIPSERGSIAIPLGANRYEVLAISGTIVPSIGTLTAESIPGTAFRTCDVVNCPDLQASNWDEGQDLLELGIRSVIAAPLVSDGASMGTINLCSTAPDFYTADDEVLFRSVADLIASFMNTMRLASAATLRARTDGLTGCLNRRAVLSVLEGQADDARCPSLIYVDVDNFKSINDQHGHAFGDRLLEILSRRLTRLLRPDDALGRVGGDEFLAVITDDPTGDIATAIANECVEKASVPVAIGTAIVEPRLSVGVASSATSLAGAATLDTVELLNMADLAMYQSKDAGGGVSVADEATRHHAATIRRIDQDLDAAMANGAITFHFQPVVDMTEPRVVAAEALVRWTHPEFGPIPANLLVERIEATGRSEQFTRWSVAAVAEIWTRLRADVPWFEDMPVSINLSRRQLNWAGYADYHLSTLEVFGLQPNDVVVEITESHGIAVGDVAEVNLRKLGEAGVLIALDDFGKGHNVLGYLTRFPIHALKVDRALVSALPHSDVARKLIRGIALLSRELGLVCIVEGVETDEEAALCLDAGIPIGQGWNFGKPMPVGEFIDAALGDGAPSTPYEYPDPPDWSMSAAPIPRFP